MPKLTIDGAEVEVSDAVAAHLSKTTDRLTALEAQAKQSAEEAGRIKAAAEQETRAKEEARLKAEMEAAAKKGELDKVVELARTRESKFAGASLSNALKAAVETHPEVKRTGLDAASRSRITEDLAALIGSGLVFDLDAATVKDSTGQPVDLSARIAKAIAARPWLAEARLPPGTGGTNTSNPPGTTGARRSAMSVEDKSAFITKHGQDAYLALPA